MGGGGEERERKEGGERAWRSETERGHSEERDFLTIVLQYRGIPYNNTGI